MRHRILPFLALALLCACGPQWQETEIDGYRLVTQRRGPELGVSSAPLIQAGGRVFKDLNRNGRLDVYEDWRQPALKRAQDLAAQLDIEQIAGLMLYSGHQGVPADTITARQRVFLEQDNLRAVLVTSVASPEVAARWNNRVQAFVEGLSPGIPANNSSDPRNETRATAEYNAGAGGQISLWPSSLGLAATFDPDIVRRFGTVASSEYRALGIATALSPQIDLATEPRWSRFSGTFGEDPELDIAMARAYVEGFQTTEGARDGWGAQSVNAMVKHWPSGGPEEGGRDAHYSYGKYAVYPGGNFQTHLRPFVEGAFKVGGGTGSASAVMPYYTISYGIDPQGRNVGNNYSEYIIGELLRKEQGFEGVVCTDWNITKDNRAIEAFDGKYWGVETLTEAQRHYEAIKAGVDQFGGNNDKGPVLEAYRMWVAEFGEQSARERFERSAVRLLLNSFRTGLFENPYTDPAVAAEVVGKPEYMEAGYDAQRKSVVLLKNHDATLQSIASKQLEGAAAPTKVYAPKGIQKELVERHFTWVDDPAEADAALVLIQGPRGGSGYDVADRARGGNGYVPISLQYRPYLAEYARAESLAGGDPKEDFVNRSYKDKTVVTANESDLDLVLDTRKAMGQKPVVVCVQLSRPAVLAELEPYADVVFAHFGVQNQVLLELVGRVVEPSGLLPMQLPADMRTVEEQCEDVPRDMRPYIDSEDHAYDFAFGMNWSGVIDDERVAKYR